MENLATRFFSFFFNPWRCRTSAESVNNSDSMSQMKETSGCVKYILRCWNDTGTELSKHKTFDRGENQLIHFFDNESKPSFFSSINLLYTDRISKLLGLFQRTNKTWTRTNRYSLEPWPGNGDVLNSRVAFSTSAEDVWIAWYPIGFRMFWIMDTIGELKT